MSDGSRETIESPCVKLCTIDPAARLCVGCLRSIDEITRWARMAPEERRAVMAALPARAPRLTAAGARSAVRGRGPGGA